MGLGLWEYMSATCMCWVCAGLKSVCTCAWLVNVRTYVRLAFVGTLRLCPSGVRERQVGALRDVVYFGWKLRTQRKEAPANLAHISHYASRKPDRCMILPGQTSTQKWTQKHQTINVKHTNKQKANTKKTRNQKTRKQTKNNGNTRKIKDVNVYRNIETQIHIKYKNMKKKEHFVFQILCYRMYIFFSSCFSIFF